MNSEKTTYYWNYWWDGSGKTTVTKEIIKSISTDNVVVIEQDSYYKDQSDISFEERVNTQLRSSRCI